MKSIQIEVDMHRKLKILSAVSGRNIRDILIEALNLIFNKYEKEIQDGEIRK